MDVVTGMPRLTFGNSQMLGGLSLLPVLIGLLAVSQALLEAENQVRRAADAQPEIANGDKIRAEFPKLRLLLSKWKILLSSSILGPSSESCPARAAALPALWRMTPQSTCPKRRRSSARGNIEA